MRKIIVLTGSLIGLSLILNAQVGNSFPTDNAIWNEQYIVKPFGFHLYGIKGNTIINDTLYQNLYILSDTTLDCINEQGQPYGFIRQVEQKVYFKPCYDWAYPDILLYDFGASEGDTVWHGGDTYFGSDDFSSSLKYSIIEEIEIENGKKIYSLTRSDGLDDIWHEGIGSFRGLFGSITKIALYNSFPNKLVCFKHNDIVGFLDNPDCNKCFCSKVGISDKKVDISALNIFPNPAKDILNIEITENIKISSIQIYSIDGKLIQKNMRLSESGKLNIKHLKEGTYIINIITDKEEYKKVIIKE